MVSRPVNFLKGDGEMATLIRSFDWSATTLGPIDSWPQSLKTATGLLLLSPVPIVMLWGGDGYMIYNDAYSVFAAARHPQLLGSKVREGWPEVADFNDNVMRVGLAGGTLAYKDQELTLYRTGVAEQVWMNLDYSPVPGEDGEPAGVIAIVVETTERVLADRRMAAELQRQRQLLSQMPGFVCVLKGPEHIFEYANAAYMKIMGPRDLIGRSIRDALPELSGQGYFKLLDQTFATGTPHIAQGRPVLLSGETRPRYIDFVYEPIRNEAGVTTGIFVGGYDATEIHRTAEALRISEANLRALNADLERQVAERTHDRGRTWQVTTDILGIANAEGYFESTNPAWQTTLGWSSQEIAATPYTALVHPEDQEATIAASRQLIEGKPLLRYENRYRTKAGDYRWLSWVAVPEEGKFYCSARDVTAEKDQAKALAIAQEALRQSQKMEAIGQLTGGLAHDFNNLLAGISGSLELIGSRISQGRLSEVDRFIDAAQSGARRAAALTQRLLAFSRRQTLDPKPTDVNRLIAGMEEIIGRTVGPEIEVQFAGAEGLWPTHIDAPQLENALLNLSINARDAMPDGGRITIETDNMTLDERTARERELLPGQYISISVSDTGTGMSPDVKTRAFDPFFTTKPIGQGTGLGLSMIHGFVTQSGGQIRIDTALGKGTTVSVYLPRYAGDIGLEEDAVTPREADSGHGETVLVIDDEPMVRMLMVEVLNEAGYAAIEADDGAGGLKVLQSDTRIDLLITDVGLPGSLNGRQVADAARETRPELKVLFVTGYAENAAVGKSLLDSGMQVITKPFAISALGNKVREMIEG